MNNFYVKNQMFKVETCSINTTSIYTISYNTDAGC